MRGFKYTVSLGFSAINTNQVKVTFNNAVEDTTKAIFAVKRGVVTETIAAPTWNEAKTEAVLERAAGDFPATDYTVEVTGLTEAALTGAVTVKAEDAAIKSVVIKNENLQVSVTAPLSIDFINGYGKAATISRADSKLNITVVADGVAQVVSGAKFEVNNTAAKDKDAVITVFYDGIVATKTVKTVAAASVNTVTLGNAVLPSDKTRFTPTGTTNVELTYTATDSLGGAYKLVAGDKNVTVNFISSDPAILNVADVTIDGNNKIKIGKFGKAGTVNLTAIVPASGASSTATIVVEENAGAAYSATLAETSVEFAAGGVRDVYVGLSVVDKYGDTVAAKNLGTKGTEYIIGTDNPNVVTLGNTDVVNTEGDPNYGKLHITTANVAKGQTAVVTLTIAATGEKTSVTVTASDAPVPTSIDIKKDTIVNSNMLVGATQTLQFDTKDQYGNAAVEDADASIYTVHYVTTDSSVVSLDETDDADITSVSVIATAAKEGTATVKAQLMKSGVAVAEKAYTFTIAKNDTTAVTYSIGDIPVLYKNAGVANKAALDAAEVDKGYAKEIKVLATDANGATYAVPAENIVSVTSDNANVITNIVSGKYYVATNNVTATDKDVTAKLTIVINAADTIKTITQDITISKDALQAASVAFKDVVPSVTAAKATTTKDVDAYAVANKAGYVSVDQSGTQDVFVWVTDQFGGYSLSSSAATLLAPVDGVTGMADDTVAISLGAVNVADTGGDTAFSKNGAKFRVIANSGAFSDFITVTVTDGILAKAGTPTAAAYDPTTGVLTLTTVGATAGDTVDVTKVSFTSTGTPFTGPAGNFALTTSTGVVTNATTITITLSAADKAELALETTLANVGVTTTNGLVTDVANGASLDGAATLNAAATTVTGE